jgi:hypothetical protein
MRTQSIVKEESSFIGIDYHKRYSVFCVLNAQGGFMDRTHRSRLPGAIYCAGAPLAWVPRGF